MEDVLIGRDTNSGDRIVVVSTTATMLLEASMFRYCVIISPPLAGQVSIGFDPNHVVSGGGIILPSGADPLVLTIQEHGDIVRRAIYAAVDAGTRNVSIMYSIMAENNYGASAPYIGRDVLKSRLRNIGANAARP
jgi:hypothetical protein